MIYQKFKKPLDILMRDITTLGGMFFYVIIVGFAFVLGENNLGLKLIFGFMATLIITIIIRSIYFKNRPVKEGYSNILEKIDASSFPSLHTSRIVFIALTMITFLKNELWASLFFVALAILIPFSRIYLKKHDMWDVLGGICLAALLWGTTFWF